MIDLGLITYFIGMEIKQSKNEIFICQKKYANENLKNFYIENCKPTTTPMNQKKKFSKEDGTNRFNEEKFKSMIGCLYFKSSIPFHALSK